MPFCFRRLGARILLRPVSADYIANLRSQPVQVTGVQSTLRISVQEHYWEARHFLTEHDHPSQGPPQCPARDELGQDRVYPHRLFASSAGRFPNPVSK